MFFDEEAATPMGDAGAVGGDDAAHDDSSAPAAEAAGAGDGSEQETV